MQDGDTGLYMPVMMRTDDNGTCDHYMEVKK